jgi:hypothetical protein
MPFNENTGNPLDYSGFSLDGTATGTSWVTGQYGYALDFNGTNCDVTVTHDARLNVSDDLSIECWFNVDDISVRRGLYIKNTPTQYFAYIHETTNRVAAGIFSGSAEKSFDSGSGNTISTGQWYHFVFTFDSTTGIAMIYLDGSVANSANLGVSSIDTGSGDLKIGGYGGTSIPFDGKIDEFRIWNRVLSPAEVYASYLLGGLTN